MTIEWTDDMKALMQRHMDELTDMLAPLAKSQFHEMQRFLDENSSRHNDLKLNAMAHMYAKGCAMIFSQLLNFSTVDSLRLFEAALNDSARLTARNDQLTQSPDVDDEEAKDLERRQQLEREIPKLQKAVKERMEYNLESIYDQLNKISGETIYTKNMIIATELQWWSALVFRKFMHKNPEYVEKNMIDALKEFSGEPIVT